MTTAARRFVTSVYRALGPRSPYTNWLKACRLRNPTSKNRFCLQLNAQTHHKRQSSIQKGVANKKLPQYSRKNANHHPKGLCLTMSSLVGTGHLRSFLSKNMTLPLIFGALVAFLARCSSVYRTTKWRKALRFYFGASHVILSHQTQKKKSKIKLAHQRIK